jgi:hypothetical protein
MSITDLRAVRSRGSAEENEKMAKTFEDAAKRARRGDFKSVAWFASGRDDFGAHFGWHKFGTIIPLIGAGFAMLQEMTSSPAVPLTEIDEPDLFDGEDPTRA